MDSAKIFALGLAAGLAIHVFIRNSSTANKAKDKITAQQSGSTSSSSIAKSSKKNKNKKKNTATSSAKDADSPPASTPAEAVKEVLKEVKEVVKEQPPVASAAGVSASTSSNKKKNKKQKQQQQQQQQRQGESYAEVAETEPGLNNETVRAKADAAQTAFTASLGDMRDADVDPLPAGYNSVARIPAPEAEKPTPKLSKKEVDEGWSSVGGSFPSSSSASVSKLNGSASSSNGSNSSNGVVRSSIASNNPFAALPDDATTSSVRRIPAKPAASSKANTAASAWTVASSTKPKNTNVVGAAAGAETKKQRSNANKAQAKKQAKEEQDRLQAERLANHRRQQALEAVKQREAAKRPTPHSVNKNGGGVASSKVPTAKASVDLNGRLVWD